MKTSLDYADYIIFGLVLLISAAIGVVFSLVGGGQKNTDEFLMAGRKMGTLPVTLSLLVSFQSAIMILGFANEMYNYGVMFYYINLAIVIAVIITAVVFVPLFRRIKVTSSFEYLEMRYKARSVRIVGGFLGAITAIFYMGVASYAPSVAINAVTGFPVWASILIVTGVSTFYTTLGGLKAVLWTDVFQFVIMMAGILGIFIKGWMLTGGLGSIFEAMDQGGRLNFAEIDANPTTRHTLWAFIFGGSIMWIAVYGISQPSVQRFNTTPTTAMAQRAVLFNIPIYIVMSTLVSVNGIIVYAYYVKARCDPLQMKYVQNGNQILPWFVMEVFDDNPGFAGLFMATLFSGALSSNSSTLSGFTAVVWEDYFKPALGKVSNFKAMLINKIIVLVFGACGTGVALLCQFLGGPVTQTALSFGAATNGPLAGLYIMGLFMPWVNWIGALSGSITGFLFLFWIIFASKLEKVCSYDPPLPRIPNDGCPVVNNTMVTNGMYYTSTGTYSTVMPPLSMNGTSPSSLCGGCCHSGPQYEGIHNLYAVSYMWYPLIGCIITIIIANIVSIITGNMKPKDVDPDLLFPPIARCLYNQADLEKKQLQKSQDDLESYDSSLTTSIKLKSYTDIAE